MGGRTTEMYKANGVQPPLQHATPEKGRIGRGSGYRICTVRDLTRRRPNLTFKEQRALRSRRRGLSDQPIVGVHDRITLCPGLTLIRMNFRSFLAESAGRPQLLLAPSHVADETNNVAEAYV